MPVERLVTKGIGFVTGITLSLCLKFPFFLEMCVVLQMFSWEETTVFLGKTINEADSNKNSVRSPNSREANAVHLLRTEQRIYLPESAAENSLARRKNV